MPNSLLAPPIKQSPINPAGTPAVQGQMPPAMPMPSGAAGPGGPANALLGPAAAPPPMPTTEELTEGLHHTAYLNAKFRDLLQKPEISKKNIFDLASDIMQRGALSAPRIAKELASLPSDQDGIKAWLAAHEQTTGQQIGQILQMLHGTAPQDGGGAQMMPGQ